MVVKKLRILIADPDRDFLVSYEKLVSGDGHEPVIVFDGTQVLSAVSGNNIEIVILSEKIPRISCRKIVSLLNEMNIPVVVTMENNPGADLLSGKTMAQSYMVLPFFPSELRDRIREISKKKSAAKIIRYEDIEIDTGNFILRPDIRVTNEEINIISALVSKGKLNEKKVQPYINALNNKFRALGKKIHIGYVMKEGYRLVSNYE